MRLRAVVGVLVVLVGNAARAQEAAAEVTTPPLVQAEPAVAPQPSEAPRREPEVTHEVSVEPGREPSSFWHRIGPHARVAMHNPQGLKDQAAERPGFSLQTGLMVALNERPGDRPQLNTAVGAFMGFESTTDGRTSLSPGLRFELSGTRENAVFLPYLGAYTQFQLLFPVGTQQVLPRFSLGVHWNIFAALNMRGSGGSSNLGSGWGSALGGLGKGGGYLAVVLVPVILVASFICLGDLQVYVQLDPRTGKAMPGFGLGLAI